MILTHFLALVGQPALPIIPAAAQLQLVSSEALISGGRLDLALVPAIKVRAAAPILAVRER